MERGLEDMSNFLKIDLVKYYGEGENQVRAVDHTSLDSKRGKFTAIVSGRPVFWKNLHFCI